MAPCRFLGSTTLSRLSPAPGPSVEYIDATDRTRKDVKLVAHAAQMLISIRGPSSAPGHVGGGPVVHTFFVDARTSSFRYETVDELEQHVNGISEH
jgi:hypothetical protein